LSGKVDERSSWANLNLLLSQKIRKGSNIHLMKLNQLFKVWELGFPAIQGESRFTLVCYLNNKIKILANVNKIKLQVPYRACSRYLPLCNC
jgi:hypothetical protein